MFKQEIQLLSSEGQEPTVQARILTLNGGLMANPSIRRSGFRSNRKTSVFQNNIEIDEIHETLNAFVKLHLCQFKQSVRAKLLARE